MFTPPNTAAFIVKARGLFLPPDWSVCSVYWFSNRWISSSISQICVLLKLLTPLERFRIDWLIELYIDPKWRKWPLTDGAVVCESTVTVPFVLIRSAALNRHEAAEHLLVFSSRRKSKGGLVMNNKQEVCFRLTIKQKLIWISSKRLFTNMFLSYYSSNNPTTKPAICTGLYTCTALLYLYYMKLTIPLYQ